MRLTSRQIGRAVLLLAFATVLAAPTFAQGWQRTTAGYTTATTYSKAGGSVDTNYASSYSIPGIGGNSTVSSSYSTTMYSFPGWADGNSGMHSGGSATWIWGGATVSTDPTKNSYYLWNTYANRYYCLTGYYSVTGYIATATYSWAVISNRYLSLSF